jgi:hypothetical protein
MATEAPRHRESEMARLASGETVHLGSSKAVRFFRDPGMRLLCTQSSSRGEFDLLQPGSHLGLELLERGSQVEGRDCLVRENCS